MDAVIGAFGGALEALESSDVEEERAERLVHVACAAVDVLCDALKGAEEFAPGLGGSLRGQSIAKDVVTWVRAVYTSWESVVRGNRGVKVAQRLDSVAPNLCATWLEALKSLGSCAVVAKGVVVRQKELMKLGREDSRVNFNGAVVEGEGLEREELLNWTREVFLSTAWPELKDRGGLRSSRWRARVSAVEFVSSLAEYDLDGEKSNEHFLALLEDFLQGLIFGLGIVDSQWQVIRHFCKFYPLIHALIYFGPGGW